MQRKWMAWWYVTIAAGFALLSLVHIMSGDRPWLVGIRLVIAAGFAFLASMEFRSTGRK